MPKIKKIQGKTGMKRQRIYIFLSFLGTLTLSFIVLRFTDISYTVQGKNRNDWSVFNETFDHLTKLSHSEVLSPVVYIPGTAESRLVDKKGSCDDVYYFSLWHLHHLAVIYQPTNKLFSSEYPLKTCTDNATLAGLSRTRYAWMNRLAHRAGYASQEVMLYNLQTLLGYEVGKSLFIAPYDFRMVLDDEYKSFEFSQLQEQIERAYRLNNNSPVVVIAHSFGGIWISDYLVNYVHEEWKTKYIRKVVTLGTPWAGAEYTVATVYSAVNPILPHSLSAIMYLNALRYMGAMLWLLPRPEDHTKKPIAEINGIIYHNTIEDYRKLFSPVEMLLKAFEDHVPRAWSRLQYPNVNLSIIYSKDLPTLSLPSFKGPFRERFSLAAVWRREHDVGGKFASGDSLVTEESATYPQVWMDSAEKLGKFIRFHKLSGQHHDRMLETVKVFKILVAELAKEQALIES